MSGLDERPDKEFRIDVGRASKGQTFVRVVHLPSGKERIRVGIGAIDAHQVAEQLMNELRKDLSM